MWKTTLTMLTQQRLKYFKMLFTSSTCSPDLFSIFDNNNYMKNTMKRNLYISCTNLTLLSITEVFVTLLCLPPPPPPQLIWHQKPWKGVFLEGFPSCPYMYFRPDPYSLNLHSSTWDIIVHFNHTDEYFFKK